ncbi:unnamed protein product [Adineta ricciae]|uniref:catechol O-methyltransferase n=1 Tax=Adineta ricciae TaxID=249248 RepID=A0A814JXP3_ADIRI|nr:unnamed protein product [Adineta ricciae]
MQHSHAGFLDYVLKHSQEGNIQSVINTIDRYGWTKGWLMNIGDQKGQILDEAIRSRKPKTVLELGTFLGYSSLRMAAQLPNDAVIICVDMNPETTEIARAIHKHAGVGDRIRIIVDSSERVIPQLIEKVHINSFDFIFIDHYGSHYLRDFKLLEEYGLIRSGTMIVADNVIAPGAPGYLQYVRNNQNYRTKTHESLVEYTNDMVDGVEVTVRN